MKLLICLYTAGAVSTNETNNSKLYDYQRKDGGAVSQTHYYTILPVL
jgi:hypothetical protein